MDDALAIPGVGNTWTMPIIGRIDMLSTGIRSPLGVKIFGPHLDEIERIGLDVERPCGRSPARGWPYPSARIPDTFSILP